MLPLEYLLEILAFAPHPDDAELYCGGTLAQAGATNRRSAIVDLTRGELSSRGNVELRAEEASGAASLLRLTHRENLGLPDGGLNENSPEQLDRIVECLRRLRPELILIPYPQERHPDHECASRLLTRALFAASLIRFNPGLGPAFRPRQTLLYPMRYETLPSFIVDISSVHETKQQAIRCYGSQLHNGAIESSAPSVTPSMAPTGEQAETLIGSAGAFAAHTARDFYFGSMIGASAGEPFVSVGALRVNDPLTFFRDNPVPGRFFFPDRG